MANVTVKTAAGATVSFKTDGAGTDLDPHVSHIVVDSSALPTGAATAALQTTGNTALSAIQTAVEIIDNAIAGTEMQVDVLTLPALPTGTNNIGDVDVLSIAAGDNNIGNVDIVTMPTVTIGNLTESLVDDAAFTPATSRVLPVGFEFDDTTPDSVNEGDIGAARMSANRNQYVTLRDAAGNERGANVTAGNALVVDGSAVTQPVSGTVTANLAAGTNNIGDVDVLTVPAPLNLTGGGVEASALRVTLASDSTGVLSVDDNGAALTVDNGGTFVVQESGAALTALQLIDNLVVVEDAPASGGESGVQMLGVRKDTGGTLASLDGDFTPLQTDSSGNLRVNVAAGGAGDGAILDGVTSSIKATVLDFTNSNPLAVRLTDTNGDYIAAGAGTQYTEDVASAADPIGTALIMVRDDVLSAQTSADGDNIAARGTDKGELYVKHVDAIPVTDNAGSLTVDNAALSVVGGGVEATALRVTIASDSTGVLSIDDNGGSLTVDGTVAVSGAVDTELPAAAALADNAANPTAPAVGAFGMVWDGATWDRAAGNSADGALVNLGANNDVTVTGTVTANLAAGTNNIGDVDVLSIAAGDNNIGNVDIVSLPALATGTNSIGRVNPEPQTANGLSISRVISAATTNATSVKASAGQVYSIIVMNATTGSVRYLKLYNKASAPTVGTDTPVMTIPIPGTAITGAGGAGVVIDTGGMGIAFSTGIALALTTGVADADTGAVAANEIVVNLLYK